MDSALCIYTKKTDTDASFKTREHIIPKCIGGIECLPLGWVSDEVNNEFSALELEFARNGKTIFFLSRIGLWRMDIMTR